MKKNMKSFKSGLAGISLALLLVAGFVGCTESGAKKEDNPTALLYLVNNSAGLNDVQSACVIAYTAANSCVGGKEYFNAGIGCSLTKLEGKTTDDLNALKECVLKKVNDPVQPCNLPQFTYGLAQQALAGAFAACNASYTTAAGTTVDLTGYLVY
ncbi:hypothetical protein EHQ23_08005 [Leptospira bourretii]|uniref:Lipoprotein n=1 Tax=Leptospira bourretii TaxID=2484962 RepID=A0A4R9IPG1_9LEPT|nr:hypothetical protein [Leptospira bourretii]TGK86335.1 hypothetical protein EHQ23_08005 [Leptospira bourretii]TGK92368.1 hypothetical protein EHQ26_09375 [Leptospira bourretii]TGL20582.1 hypothetical protein EHQ47_13660 [Leptospira bourretii]TGL32848.1 hypothetical protein EHQ45_11395 [Leptospira bourretii]